MATPKRTVSFGPAEVEGPGSVAMTPNHSSQSNGASTSTFTPTPNALKPALKAGTDRKKLPSKEQYQHPDPLLRRLRLVDSAGEPVNLRTHFRGVKCVGFYFSSQWAGQPLKEYHQTINDFAMLHPNEFKVVYVSVDVDEQWYKAGVKGQPWVSMVWNDGSSLPSERNLNASSASSSTGPLGSSAVEDDSMDDEAQLYNDEDFLLASETDIDESLSKSDTSGTAYLRPFSRVHLASKLNIIAAPTLCVYHLEKQKMLDWNVRMARLSKSRRQDTWERWLRGESPQSIGLSEAIQRSPTTFLLGVFALAYWLLVYFGGPQYNFLRHLIDRLDGSTSAQSPTSQDTAPFLQGVAKDHFDF